MVAGGYFFFALYMVVSTPIFYSRKTGWAPIISGAAAMLNVVVNLVLIPRFGMLGAAWATLVAYLFMALVARCGLEPDSRAASMKTASSRFW